VKERREWEKDLVKIYLAEFAKSGGPTLDEDLAWKEIKGQSFGGASVLRDAFQLIPVASFGLLDVGWCGLEDRR
jgi:hypothetical protein